MHKFFNDSRGFAHLLVIVVVAVLLIAGASFYFIKQKNSHALQSTTSKSTAPAAVAPTTSPPKPAITYTQNSIAWIGCSNSRQSAAGYATVSSKKLLWPDYDTDSQDLGVWAKSSSAIWNKFDAFVTQYGKPKAVWAQLCAFDYDAVKGALANLKTHAPDAKVYVSPLNSYSPEGLCASIPAAAVTGTTFFAKQAVADGLASLGPTNLGPLTDQTAANDNFGRCHLNPDGQKLIGKQLSDFFDSL